MRGTARVIVGCLDEKAPGGRDFLDQEQDRPTIAEEKKKKKKREKREKVSRWHVYVKREREKFRSQPSTEAPPRWGISGKSEIK